MNPEAKVWVYQSERLFAQEELVVLNAKLSEFVEGWKAHGAMLSGAFEIIENLFIVLMVDETQRTASGCSIDSSVATIRKLEQELNVNLTDKSSVAYQKGDEICMVNFRDIKRLVFDGLLTEDSVVYDNSVTNYASFITSWKTEAKNTWLKRYFNS